MQEARNRLDHACSRLAAGWNALPIGLRRWFATHVTNRSLEFRVLGPLDVRLAGESLVLGGGKQRAVLAILLLRAGEVVPVERLVDEVWGTDPPPSAAHTLESYVSRLRQLFNGSGTALVRRGAGYAIELGDAVLDARVFVDLQERAALAAAVEAHTEVLELTAAALRMWRGPALADVALASAGRSEGERLEELRLRTFELRFDAELALRQHEAIIGELQVLVGQNPYRERFVAQLMLALYRSGRQAEALDVYEQTRRRLDEDLGLQPSPELQQLSGQIVRQETHLHASSKQPAEPPFHAPRRPRRIATLVAGGLAVAAVMSLTASGGTASSEPGRPTLEPLADRVALVLPRDPVGADERDASVYWSAKGFRTATTTWGHETQTFVVDETDADRRARDIVDGDFDLVVVAGDGPAARALVPLVPDAEQTNFAFIGPRLSDLGLLNVSNAAAYSYAEQESLQLAGYMSALAPPRHAPAGRTDMISMVVGPSTPAVERMVAGFRKGAKHASPNVRVRVDHVRDATDRSACEAVANRQVSAGSDVVLALGSVCGSGALAVVRVRGVWGIRAEDDRIQVGPHILGTLSHYWESAVARPVYDIEYTSFPAAKTIELGLADDYSVLFLAEEARVSEALWEKVVHFCSTIRSRTHHDA
jgi:DNA-binding SARP family transcriptional activator/basic membrane lipoprotein Med (substrate-binding protein (PBP1-ABC) superfamily)